MLHLNKEDRALSTLRTWEQGTAVRQRDFYAGLIPVS